MSIKVEKFGIIKDDNNNEVEIKKISLINKKGNIASFINFGAVWTNMLIKDKNNSFKDVVFGFDDIKYYQNNTEHIGSPIGRYANRISNAKFTLNGIEYFLEQNKGIHNLHSGSDYWDLRIWEFDISEEDNSVIFKLFSPHLDQNFPGNAELSIKYSFNDEDALSIEYELFSDKDTFVNLTNHAYFNLNGCQNNSILEHFIKINADYYNVLDEDSVATGEIASLADTPLDFRKEKLISKDIDKNFKPLIMAKGYDHNFILNKDVKEEYKGLKMAAIAKSLNTGIKMEVYTDLEGLQFYTANYLNLDIPAKKSCYYKERSSFCFETGHLPNALNIKNFKSPLVLAKEKYYTQTIYKFDILEN